MRNSKEWLICSKSFELFLRPTLWKRTSNDPLFIGPHSWTSARQSLHIVKHVATSCVGLTLSSLIGSSVLGAVCFALSFHGAMNWLELVWEQLLLVCCKTQHASDCDINDIDCEHEVSRSLLSEMSNNSSTHFGSPAQKSPEQDTFLHAEGEPRIVSIWQWPLSQPWHWTSETNFSEARKIAALSFNPCWVANHAEHKSNQMTQLLHGMVACTLRKCCRWHVSVGERKEHGSATSCIVWIAFLGSPWSSTVKTLLQVNRNCSNMTAARLHCTWEPGRTIEGRVVALCNSLHL